MSDVVTVKVRLRTTDAPNESSIRADWQSLLNQWAKANGCIVEHIEWDRYRRSDVHDSRGNQITNWDLVEKSKTP